MVKIPNMFEENVEYELIPGDNDHWHVRVITGDFIECVISFGQIKLKDDEFLSFDFTLHYSPDPDLTEEDYNLQKYAGKMLESLIMRTINEMEN